MLIHACNVLLPEFVDKTGFEFCFWYAQCIERQARTSNKVETWNSSSLNVPRWSFIVNVVYCNFLHSIKASSLEVEKAMFNVVTLVPMFTLINPGPYTRSRKQYTIHA